MSCATSELSANSNGRAAERAEIEEAFASAQRGGSTRQLSPSGRYELEVVSWENRRGYLPGSLGINTYRARWQAGT